LSGALVCLLVTTTLMGVFHAIACDWSAVGISSSAKVWVWILVASSYFCISPCNGGGAAAFARIAVDVDSML